MKIEIIEKEFGKVLEIEELVPMMKMPKVMGIDFTKLVNYANENSLKITEAPYSRYVGIDWEKQVNKGFIGNMLDVFTKKWHFFCGIAVDSEVKLIDNIKMRDMKIKKYLCTLHKGPYQNVGPTYKAMYNWAKENRVELDSECFECYLNDPSQVSKDNLETMIYIAVK